MTDENSIPMPEEMITPEMAEAGVTTETRLVTDEALIAELNDSITDEDVVFEVSDEVTDTTE